MRVIRDALLNRRGWLALTCALALAVRLLVPAGYMPAQVGGLTAITICDGTGDQMVMRGMSGMGGMNGKHGDHGRSSAGCPFGVAAMASLGGVDAIVLSARIVRPFIVGHILGQPSARLATARLRPPAQGPPAL